MRLEISARVGEGRSVGLDRCASVPVRRRSCNSRRGKGRGRAAALQALALAARGCPAMLGQAARRGTHSARLAASCVRTAAASQSMDARWRAPPPGLRFSAALRRAALPPGPLRWAGVAGGEGVRRPACGAAAGEVSARPRLACARARCAAAGRGPVVAAGLGVRASGCAGHCPCEVLWRMSLVSRPDALVRRRRLQRQWPAAATASPSRCPAPASRPAAA